MARGYRFTVVGNYPFPLDMLRYDGCYPASTEDATAISASIRGERDEGMGFPRGHSVTLYSNRAPTEGRWQSFLWHVVKTERT